MPLILSAEAAASVGLPGHELVLDATAPAVTSATAQASPPGGSVAFEDGFLQVESLPVIVASASMRPTKRISLTMPPPVVTGGRPS